MTGAVRYVLGEGRGAGNDNLAPGEKSRVEWVGGDSFGFPIRNADDADLARRIMEFDALNQGSRTKRCVNDVVHLALSWRPGETPDRAEMEEAARGALSALGMKNAKALYVCHNDEAHPHLHIVASKINPDTGRAFDLKGNYLKLSKWAEEWELTHGGVMCQRRAGANALRDAIETRNPDRILAALTAQRATFTKAEFERALGKQVSETQTRERLLQEVINHPDIVRLKDERGERYTVEAALVAEEYVLRAANGLLREARHAVPIRLRDAVMSREHYLTMRPDQRDAFKHATRTGGLALIDGQAGTGKSFTMSAIRDAYESAGYQVIGLAPTNVVARDLERDGFKEARTVHSALFALNNDRMTWSPRTVVMVDEAAMVDTRLMAMVTTHAQHAGAKLILVGDDRQLASIERGGMFGVLKDRYGAASLTGVIRQRSDDDRRAASMMAEGNFHDALAMYDAKGGIRWTRTEDQARAALAEQWALDSAASPGKSRFVFAYTNKDVGLLNEDLRQIRRKRGELGPDHLLASKDGEMAFAEGDRVQFTGTDKKRGLFNGAAGVVRRIEGTLLSVRMDGRRGEVVTFDTQEYAEFRHGYAGTIYKGQGRTLDQTYLFHSEHWRSSASYVALTRHRDKAELFVARNTARDVTALARQMARVDDRRAAVQFGSEKERGPVRPLSPKALAAQLSPPRDEQQPVPGRGDATGRGGRGGKTLVRFEDRHPGAARDRGWSR